MTASAGSLDGLLNYGFAISQFAALTAQSGTATSSGDTDQLLTLTAAATGASFDQGGAAQYATTATLAIVGVNDAAGTVQIASYDAGANYLGTLTYSVAGFSANALLVSFYPPGTVAFDVLANNFADLNPVIAAIAVAPLAAGTGITFAADGTFAGGGPCFAAGTRIRTASGDLAVEDLRPGARILSARTGRWLRMTWLGRRTLDAARHPRPADVAPVRIRAHAFVPGQPARDLRLSPDHAVFADGVLIPVRHLLNGATIVQEPAARITYFHVELEAHDVLFAEGLPAESYLDTGNRGAFDNAPGAVTLTADFARRAWAARGCAPLLTGGRMVEDLVARLTARAVALGWRRSGVPSVEIYAAGRRLAAAWRGPHCRAELPAAARTLRLRARTGGAAGRLRPVGVALAEVRLDRAPVPAAGFLDGWGAAEGEGRWIDGEARLATGGARELTFTLTLAEAFWEPPSSAAAA
ncbi:MAG: Hint domain-containing protein [Alphaproteobacteria bacterium]|nr:Hint domain-containing protein [Alphaproteobacteria bacterium]